MTHFSKVKCIAQQLFLSLVISSKLKTENLKQFSRCSSILLDEMFIMWLYSCNKRAVKMNNAPVAQTYTLRLFCQVYVQAVV